MSSFRAGACASAERPVSAHSGRKEFIEAIGVCQTRVRWTQSFPRTRERPDAQPGRYPQAADLRKGQSRFRQLNRRTSPKTYFGATIRAEVSKRRKLEYRATHSIRSTACVILAGAPPGALFMKPFCV
jgi:hypothetical protein